jgi:hypothetical protein
MAKSRVVVQAIELIKITNPVESLVIRSFTAALNCATTVVSVTSVTSWLIYFMRDNPVPAFGEYG